MSTIKDVAKLSQTSVGTVSRYLNGYPIKTVNKEKIEDAIKCLDFSINPIARGLKTNKTYTVGILIPKLANLFSTSVIEGMDQVFDPLGYSILVCDSKNSLEKEKEKLRLFKDKLVDGIILMPVNNTEQHIREIQENGVPIVLIDRLVNNLQCDGVVSDNVNGVYQAVEAIINRGHRRIAIIAGPQNIYPAKERLEGYLRAMKDYNIEVDHNLIYQNELTREGGYQGIASFCAMDEPPTAIFTSNDETTIGAYKSIIERGLLIGEDISLFGYDQTELCQMVRPQISVVIQPLETIGKRSAEILISRMKGDYTGFPIINRLKTEIVVTNSVKTIY
ncbi:LacI family DNA-binding transcriptional regulator [Pelosinus baikalensis]|uniref:LacI family transcriptional regulator n=1 Tax=Pelosinus baikalensis TaxID=2892015 RepID=A0ABS8HN36_9FIRM|nr:LacI family DNA-binding transcriptional regulator [Pelosinus baikalensis]MCC5464632.1 LacI family transcriptional regulator [Pelosinus baikalensis]